MTHQPHATEVARPLRRVQSRPMLLQDQGLLQEALHSAGFWIPEHKDTLKH